MRILVTNDDGIDSEGLHVLAQHLTLVGEVTVFAPSGEYSGAGAAIGHLAEGIADVHQVDHHPAMPDVAAAYHFDGPPALASLLACRGLFGAPPEIVVSGINPGWNVGHAVHFSGTIGACITAGIFAIPAIAVSQPTGPNQWWSTAAQSAIDQIPRAVADTSLLNVNVPNVALDEVKGTVNTTLADRIPYSLHSPTLSSAGGGCFKVSFDTMGPFHGPEGTDTHAVEAGYVSVTALASTRPVG